jgi:hypothetical protein
MHCDCCDKLLTDSEATAKFESGEYVSMCTKCREYLPKELKVFTRSDLEDQEDEKEGWFDFETGVDDDD